MTRQQQRAAMQIDQAMRDIQSLSQQSLRLSEGLGVQATQLNQVAAYLTSTQVGAEGDRSGVGGVAVLTPTLVGGKPNVTLQHTA